RRASRILEAALQDPVYMEHLQHRNRRQMIMVGYSDSSKDGGYLMANWSLYQAQQELCAIAKDRDIRLFFFHGRGGSLGRGGGPAARSILALPPASASTGLRMTEQGEVLAERYDNPAVTYRHLEQVLWATLTVNSHYNSRPKSEWKEKCSEVAEASYAAYRTLVEHPQFITYFHEASPLAEIEALPIGSRPSRRSGTSGLEDLRAIPWAFSWTQNRHLLPAWYGLGQACFQTTKEGRITWGEIQEMYREWPFFHAIINNAMLGLAKADLSIARHYLRLTRKPEESGQILSMVVEEYQRSRDAVKRIVGVEDLLENIPWLERSIAVRNPYVDPLNFIQVAWLQQLRSMGETDAERKRNVEALIRLTIYGIASGMRTTG
ncbi:MAG: phosphoenolpyruvate carboxylase, partial [Calditrichota bacterium]